MKKSQRIILCVWLILSSVLLWLKGILIAIEEYYVWTDIWTNEFIYYILAGTAVFFAGIFVLTIKKKDEK